MSQHTPGPWKWIAGGFRCPELHGSNQHPELNPILICRGCGNDAEPTASVSGCWSEGRGDDLQGCALHPTRADRAIIAAAPDAYAIIRAEYDAHDGFRTLPLGYSAERAMAICNYIAKVEGGAA